MREYEVYEMHDLGYIFSTIYGFLIESLAMGHTSARVYLTSHMAYSYLVRWMPGWVRKAGPSGIWRNSQGNLKKFLRLELMLFLGEPVPYQFLLKKIRHVIRNHVSLELEVVELVADYPFSCKS